MPHVADDVGRLRLLDDFQYFRVAVERLILVADPQFSEAPCKTLLLFRRQFLVAEEYDEMVE